ncbi:glutamine--fructose-6-phosphate transaminase (isomerizing), partial [Nesterenkonia haasae]|uniref:glutamine--fructose-6-phosphate transaminase (isomerizing) n=1 Tax=Nesterenkonia haasae TaxID=2587813 RepID=UPI0013916B59
MCGIVGYIGLPEKSVEHHALDVLMEGLRRLEYRGYDSAGVATVAGGVVQARKKSGKLANLIAEVERVPLTPASVGIGHTRWATHGGPTDLNAHPHFGDEGKLAVIHNGIIENFAQLRQRLVGQGHVFVSQTDTEVAAKLMGEAFRSSGDLTEAMRLAVNELEGAFTLLAVHPDQPDRVVAARRNSPLVVGLGEGENFLGSDVSGFIDFTREAVELEQDQIVTITAGAVSIINFDGSPAVGKRFHIDWDATAAEKGGYDSFMEKEINEQPKAVEDTLLGRTDAAGRLTLDELRISAQELKDTSKIIVLACGTAAYAGTVAKYAIEHWTRIPVEVELAHEFRYRDPIIDETTLVVSISQSGETMDTLMAVRYAKEQGARTLSICNTNGSTIPRESDAVLYLHAGPEIAVASTKAFLAMITASCLLGLYLGQLRGQLFTGQISDILADLHKIPEKIQTILDSAEDIKALARAMAQTPSVLFLGRHVGFPVAMEGALKLKELAYIHAEGFAAGELKHG